MAPRHPHSLTGSNYPPGAALYPPSGLVPFGEELAARSPYLLEMNKSTLGGLAQERSFDLAAVEAALDAAHEHLDAAIATYRDEIAAALADVPSEASE